METSQRWNLRIIKVRDGDQGSLKNENKQILKHLLSLFGLLYIFRISQNRDSKCFRICLFSLFNDPWSSSLTLMILGLHLWLQWSSSSIFWLFSILSDFLPCFHTFSSLAFSIPIPFLKLTFFLNHSFIKGVLIDLCNKK